VIAELGMYDTYPESEDDFMQGLPRRPGRQVRETIVKRPMSHIRHIRLRKAGVVLALATTAALGLSPVASADDPVNDYLDALNQLGLYKDNGSDFAVQEGIRLCKEIGSQRQRSAGAIRQLYDENPISMEQATGIVAYSIRYLCPQYTQIALAGSRGF
jgi:hypothetical protein